MRFVCVRQTVSPSFLIFCPLFLSGDFTGSIERDPHDLVVKRVKDSKMHCYLSNRVVILGAKHPEG
jgi:hypothetical protein